MLVIFVYGLVSLLESKLIELRHYYNFTSHTYLFEVPCMNIETAYFVITVYSVLITHTMINKFC